MYRERYCILWPGHLCLCSATFTISTTTHIGNDRRIAHRACRKASFPWADYFLLCPAAAVSGELKEQTDEVLYNLLSCKLRWREAMLLYSFCMSGS